MSRQVFVFNDKTGAEVAEIYNFLIARKFYELSSAILTGYAIGAPTQKHFNDFIAHVQDGF